MTFSFWDFFTHPLLKGPTWGTLFLSVASSLMGVILFLQKRPLLSESLSHATWPGILLALIVQAIFFPGREEGSFFLTACGGGLFAWLGLKAIVWMERRGRVPSDAALAFTLASFFGIGTLMASFLQRGYPKPYQQVQTLLFGQAATLDDSSILLYGLLAAGVALFLFLTFRQVQLLLFDRQFAFCSKLKMARLETCLTLLLLLSLMLGIRSVGVLLISGMSIAPAIAARQFTDRLQTLFLLAAFFGALSGLSGTLLSVYGTLLLSQGGGRHSLPTGPMIIAVGGAIALFSLLFAPKRGLLFRLLRIASFRLKCVEENFLKSLRRQNSLSFQEMRRLHQTPYLLLLFVLFRLQNQGWIEKQEGYQLTADGLKKASSIVRLHRLWELYLAHSLGLEKDKVHMSAEEMEHILTPEFEEKLTSILSDPKTDPHDQHIPERPGL